ncbi:MAG: ATPase P [Clostridiales bacterium]|nr:ATPase P [Clostridiales bacterium]
MLSQNLSLPECLPDDFVYTGNSGLTQEEVERAILNGLANKQEFKNEKTIGSIIFSNVVNFFNILNFVLGGLLFAAGSYKNMSFLLIVISNTAIGIIQELRAQKAIRNLQLMNAPEVHVLRDGTEKVIRPDEAVKGDLVILRAGDQVIADAVVVSGNGSAMESLLTGESHAVSKRKDSWLYSGSFISEGKITAQLVYVADESYASRLTKEAKRNTRPQSRLINELNRLISMDSLILIPVGILLFLKQIFLDHLPIEGAEGAVTSSVAAMIGMIPEGLVLLTGVAMAVGVIRLGQKSTLVQELNGIETLARADVLCLDKTGTITSGNMELERTIEINGSSEEIEDAASRLLSAFDDDSGTLNALRKVYNPGSETPAQTIPFSSARKLSAASFDDGKTVIMGAPAFVLNEKDLLDLNGKITDYSALGLRITVLCEADGTIQDGVLPKYDRILCLFAFQDEIREGAAQTVEYFRQQDVTLKIISGDDPVTVSQIARKVGISHPERFVDASTLKDENDIEYACEKYTVFGRVTPEQKKQLVLALQKKNHNVAMTGDGVNDIPAMKAADCSIAMATGADAAKNAAQITLLTSDFSVMPSIVLEGRRVINNITRSASLFLTKTLFSFIISLLTFFMGSYPFIPIQLTLISSLTVGIPSFFLALEPSKERIKADFLPTVIRKALPGALAISLCCASVMLLGRYGWDNQVCSTIATIIAGIVGFVVLLRASIPFSFLRFVIFFFCLGIFVAATFMLKDLFSLATLRGDALIALGILAVVSVALVFAFDLLLAGIEKKKKENT